MYQLRSKGPVSPVRIMTAPENANAAQQQPPPQQQQQHAVEIEAQPLIPLPPPPPTVQPNPAPPSVQPVPQAPNQVQPPPGYSTGKIQVTLNKYNGTGDALQFWTKFMAFVMLQKMTELEAVLSLSFYLTDIAENWYLLLDDNVKSSLQTLKQAFVQRFQIIKQDDLGLTNLRQLHDETVNQYIHRALGYNKNKSCSEEFLVKLTYMGLKPAIQQIVVPQNPTGMNDLLTKAQTAEMTINLPGKQETSIEASIIKSVSSLEDRVVDKLSGKLETLSISALNNEKPKHTHDNGPSYVNNASTYQPPLFQVQYPQMQQQQPQQNYMYRNERMKERFQRGYRECDGCGKSCKSRSDCPATLRSCNYCKAPGHFRSKCPLRKRDLEMRPPRR